MMLEPGRYTLEGMDMLETPALVYYKDIIEQNTREAIAVAGCADRLWPHVKSHKMREMILMQRRMGIDRFKCATIAEAQMVADAGAAHILLAYPLVGPNIRRFITLQQAFQGSQFYAIGDDYGQMEKLAVMSKDAGLRTMALIDVNMGMNRTGVALEDVDALYRRCAELEGLEMVGLHCYDGHVHHPDFDQRVMEAQAALDRAHALRRGLEAGGYLCSLLVMGGTPSFPVHARYDGVYLSPGTVFLSDIKSMQNIRDLSIEPAAGIWTRVISHPAAGTFTLDIGTKAISTDHKDGRGVVVGMEDAVPLFQSEEHWVFAAPEGRAIPAIGEVFLVIPLHICPATALYPFAHIASGGKIVDRWEVTARNRNLGI